MVQIITTNGGGGGGVGVYKYKGSVNSYNDLPSSGMKIGDVYNVVNAHTTNPKFPAGSNLAWTGTEWDVLGGNIDLSEYQKKLVEGEGIDINSTTNEISVESSVVSGAAAGATAVQPGDLCAVATSGKYCDLTGTPSLCTVATSGKYCDLSGTPTIPTDNCQLANGCGYTTCTGTLSTCSDVISALGYTPYSSANPSGYTTCTGTLVASDLTPYAKSCTLCTVATSGKYCDLTGTPTIGNAKLTIQKNGTDVNSITMNATSNVTANISVPTDTSDLTNGAGFLTSSDLSGYQTTSCMVCDLTGADNSHYPTAKAVSDALSCAGAGDMMKSVYDPNNCSADAFNYNNFYNTPTIPTVVDSLCSTSTTNALSANQGKALKDLIDTYVGLGRFLSLWNSSTGQPISFPLATPYTYNTGDWYMVEVTGTTNYMPNGSSYTGSASTTVDSVNNVEVRDVYIYDGTDWLFQKNNEVQVSFSDIAGVPNDNACLCAALAGKANDNSVVKLSGNQTVCGTKTFCTSPVVPSKTSAVTNTGTAIATEAQVYTVNQAIPTDNCQLANGCGYAKTSQIPTVNNCTLTIQRNGTLVNTFTANASSNVTANIAVPTCVSELCNDSGFISGISCSDVTTALGYTPYSSANPSGYTTCTGTLVASDLTPYAKSCDLKAVATSGKYCDLTGTPTIPTDNCQLSNGCGYTTCTGTLSTCSQIISTLGYTPYNCTNPAGYTTCTGTLTAETVVSGDTGCTYTIKVSNSEPGASTPATTITFVTA